MTQPKFNEPTRVQMPALVHLLRLGYTYIGKISEEDAGRVYDPDTNILLDVFKCSFAELNPGKEGDADAVLKEIRQELDNDDMGKAFYKRLISASPYRLINFDEPLKNDFRCTAEFTCRNGEDNFRPDITLFVNGLPLCFIEVKKPNNPGGMLAESKRMNNGRLPNRKFRRFINITELMIFSNNMEYDAGIGGIVPIQGVFYCTGGRKKAGFNCFTEENPRNEPVAPFNATFPYLAIDPAVERRILSDFNCEVLHHSPEYQTNLLENSPTNRVMTSMCSKERLIYLLRYGIVFYFKQKELENGDIETIDEKHIMRYPQFFASREICRQLDEGVDSGIIWHTQGSGKTALSYHLNSILTDYFARKNQVAKFYFIVDRLDLLTQAKEEFEARGLTVATASTRAELMKQFTTFNAEETNTGAAEMTVVNIQRFDAHDKIEVPPYATNLQRVFILDEAHRGYKPGGCFLANLFDADRNSIKIALTGTPLLKSERASCKVFGNYLHTYYYDKSIKDGYTLKIIREDIETSYRQKLTEVYEKLEKLFVKNHEVKRTDIIEHDTYVKEFLRYVIHDLKMFRIAQGDPTLGGMIVCETSEQARKLYGYFNGIQDELNASAVQKTSFRAGLVLHDSDDKETRKKTVADFKLNGTIDVLIVFNMLLTGFDAPRLKRLYFGRKMKDHGLLQAITRVNRPYGDRRYGYVIDFADIKQNFDETNAEYLKELNRFNNPDEVDGDGLTETFTQVLESPDEIMRKMEGIRNQLFNYTVDNAEAFSSEVSTIEDKKELLALRDTLCAARDLGNLVRTFGSDDLKEKFEKLEMSRIPVMIREVQNAVNSINLKEAIARDPETQAAINLAMADIEFNFSKIGEEELRIIGDGRAAINEKLRKAITGFTENFDKEDEEYITLWQSFQNRCKEHGFKPDSLAKFNECSAQLDEILGRLRDLERRNRALLHHYNGDAKFARMHKRIREENHRRKAKSANAPQILTDSDAKIVDMLKNVKATIDRAVYDRNDILKRDAYFCRTVEREIANGFAAFPEIEPGDADYDFMTNYIAKQYLDQYNALYAAA